MTWFVRWRLCLWPKKFQKTDDRIIIGFRADVICSEKFVRFGKRCVSRSKTGISTLCVFKIVRVSRLSAGTFTFFCSLCRGLESLYGGTEVRSRVCIFLDPENQSPVLHLFYPFCGMNTRGFNFPKCDLKRLVAQVPLHHVLNSESFRRVLSLGLCSPDTFTSSQYLRSARQEGQLPSKRLSMQESAVFIKVTSPRHQSGMLSRLESAMEEFAQHENEDRPGISNFESNERLGKVRRSGVRKLVATVLATQGKEI